MSLTTLVYLVLLTLSFAATSFADDVQEDRYANFVFEPVYGEKRSKATVTYNRELLDTVLSSWNAGSEKFYLELESSEVFLLDVLLTEIGTYIDYKDMQIGLGKPVDPGEWQGYVSIANDQNKNMKAVVLDKKQKLLPNGRGVGDYYGCLENRPLFKHNIMGSSSPEFFTITGGGDRTSNMKGGGTYDYLTLSAYAELNETKLFDVQLMAVNYKGVEASDSIKGVYDSKFWVAASNYDRLAKIDSVAGEGRKTFSKLYVFDFNKNGFLDILIWTREYASAIRKDTPSKPDNSHLFYLDKNQFVWLEENTDQTGFVERTIGTQVAEKWLSDNDYTWTTGWPSEKNGNVCDGKASEFPMNWIGDPVLH